MYIAKATWKMEREVGEGPKTWKREREKVKEKGKGKGEQGKWKMQSEKGKQTFKREKDTYKKGTHKRVSGKYTKRETVNVI